MAKGGSGQAQALLEAAKKRRHKVAHGEPRDEVQEGIWW